MVILAVLITIVLVSAIALTLAALAFRAERRARAADREATLRAAQDALALEREHTVQAAVDTVLAVAGEKFADHSSAASHELDLRSTAISQQFENVNGQLGQVRTLVEQLQRDRAEQQGRLERGLQEAVQASTTLSRTTQSLREALASSKSRGQWGERLADDVLRTAGFVEGVNYRKQSGIATGGIPDFTFLLPQGRVLHMDVKFPLDNFLRREESDREADQAAYTKAFLKDVRLRIKEIADRAYTSPDDAIDTVLLFIPNEGIYGFIHEHDPGLVDVALRQKVVMCSPFTLFSVLAVIRQSVDAFLVERTSDQILECLAGFTGQWQKFSASVDTLGKRFESAQKAYDELAGTRRRQLQKHLDRVDALRAERGLDDDVVALELDLDSGGGSAVERPALRAVPEG
jgi:DNA recombination protein RmuC